MRGAAERFLDPGMLVRILFILSACAVSASGAYWLLAWIGTRRFFRRASPKPSEYFPSVSILKPIKGADPRLIENLTTFCQQDYPDFEILFGVADENDPALQVIDQLRQRFEKIPMQAFVVPRNGANPKSSTLDRLWREARGDVLVISDADIRVSSNYLREVVAPLSDASVGMVTCPYVGAQPQSLWARLEMLHMDVTFLPSAILAHEMLGQCVGMGATMALGKTDLDRIGGYAAFVDHLMDDYQLAFEVRRLGLKTRISHEVVQSVLGATHFRDQWLRELRWARGIRVSTPGKYPGLLLTYPIPLAVVFCCAARFGAVGFAVLLAAVALRMMAAWDIAGLVGKREDRRSLWLLPMRECMSAAVWCAGLVGRSIAWRGERFVMSRDGTLKSPDRRDGIFGRVVRWLDATLRKQQGIFDYCDDRKCMFRLSITSSPRDLTLNDGTEIRRGQKIGEIHLNNDQAPPIPPGGTDLAWAVGAYHIAKHSLELLADAMQRDERLKDIDAIFGTSVFTPKGGSAQVTRFTGRLHFETHDEPKELSLAQRLHRWGENILIWALLRTFNPGGLRNAKLARDRQIVWMSRATLLKYYGTSRQNKELAASANGGS